MKNWGVNLVILFVAAISCTKNSDKNVIAEFNNHKLYKHEIESYLPIGISKPDSALRVQNVINEWAKKLIMADKAINNLTDDEIRSFDSQIENYKNDLLINAYSKYLVSSVLDTVVSENDITDYYNNNKKSFVLKESLIHVYFLRIFKTDPQKQKIKTLLRKNDAQSKLNLENIAIQKALDYHLNDSVWIKRSELKKRWEMDGSPYKGRFQKGNFIEFSSEKETILGVIKEVKYASDQMPLQIASNLIKKLIINKRKLDTISSVSNELLENAIKNKELKIYQ